MYHPNEILYKIDLNKVAAVANKMREEIDEYNQDIEMCDRVIVRGGLGSMSAAEVEAIKCGHINARNTLARYADELTAIVIECVETRDGA